MKLLKRTWEWIEDRTGLLSTLVQTMRHPVPPDSNWYYVLGSATLVAFLIQVVTGIALSTSYITSTGQAYQSLQFITHQSAMGHVLRGMHYFGASAMVILIGLHTIRVFLTGSFKFPREMSWLTGTALLLFTILMGFTGQLLRWDQDGVWSAVIAAEQAGRTPIIGRWLAHFLLAGDTVGGATLARFFSAHVFFIPALIFAFVGVHLYLVLRNGISEMPRSGHPVDPKTYRGWYQDMLDRVGIPFWPDAAWRDVVFGVLVVLTVVTLAIVVGPPELTKPPDPSIINASPRPDWYLLWYFALLALIPKGLEDYLILYGPLVFGALLITLPFFAGRGERSPARRPWAIGVVLIAIMMIATLWIEGQRSPWSPDFTAKPLSASIVGVTSGPVADGASLFHKKGCEYCHQIAGNGGLRGPDLSTVANRLTRDQITIRIVNGAPNMPAYGGMLKPGDLSALVEFLASRK